VAIFASLLTVAADSRRSEGLRLSFFVHVVGVDDKNVARPIRGAEVRASPGFITSTNANGYAVVQSSPSVTAGEYVTIVAEHEDYNLAQVRLFVDRDVYVNAQRKQSLAGRLIGWLLGHKEPVITLTLQPRDDADPIVHLVVVVHDKNLKPVKGALVALEPTAPPLREFAHGYASAGGEAHFFVPRDLIEAGLQARVYAGSFGKKFSDISANVLKGGGERRFLVVLGGEDRPDTWSGTWSTNFNTMTLTQSGTSVEGKYAYDDGHLKGTITGNVLKGRWDEAPTRAGPNDAGPFEFTLSGKTFTGPWRHDGDSAWAGTWTGTCTAGPCLDNAK
jgi:hypothetical protein